MHTVYLAGTGVCQVSAEDVEGKRVCSTKLDSCRQPASDDWSTARDASNADLHTYSKHMYVYMYMYMYIYIIL